MKTIERQIRNHTLTAAIATNQTTEDAGPVNWGVVFRVDGVLVGRSDFEAIIALLSAEAPK